MAVIFDGKSFASEKEKALKEKVARLKKKGIIPKLFSILVGDNAASTLYVRLKKNAAERIGCQLSVASFQKSADKSEILDTITRLNDDESVHGIMIQLPLPKKFSIRQRDEIINTIAEEKDVDGLRENSKFVPPTAKAVIYVISAAEEYVHFRKYPIILSIVGANGFIGRQIVKALEDLHLNSYKIIGVDRNTPNIRAVLINSDVIITVTGSPGIIGVNDIKEGAAVIDVGSPEGDVKIEEVKKKAAFISPVPGGVGPVTISCLLENLVESAN